MSGKTPKNKRRTRNKKPGHQLALNNDFAKKEYAFGGSLLKGNNAKRARPLDSKLPIHLVLRSSLAVGAKSLNRGRRMEEVRKLVSRVCKKYGVRIQQFANAGNHLHLLLRIHKRFLWKAFICELTGRLANLVMGFGTLKASAGQKKQKFWDYRPFTRVVSGWGRSYQIAKDYVTLNILESLGVLSRHDRNARLHLEIRFETG